MRTYGIRKESEEKAMAFGSAASGRSPPANLEEGMKKGVYHSVRLVYSCQVSSGRGEDRESEVKEGPGVLLVVFWHHVSITSQEGERKRRVVPVFPVLTQWNASVSTSLYPDCSVYRGRFVLTPLPFARRPFYLLLEYPS